MQNELPDAPALFLEHWQNHNLDNNQPSSEFLNTVWETSKEKLEHLIESDKNSKRFIDNILAGYYSDEQLIKQALEKQHYELCHWQETEKRINYRRFFTVNSLICLRMEDTRVFEKYHSFIKQSIGEELFQGLRIDHIDGLNDPSNYLLNLRKLLGENIFIVAEKILEHNEDLPDFWPIQGTTGYDFLATVTNLLTNTKNYDILKSLYKEVTNLHEKPSELVYQNKKMILTTCMHGEWDNIFSLFDKLNFIDYQKEKISREIIKKAIGEFMLACPVYRLYPRKFPLQNQSKKIVEEILEKAKKRNPAVTPALERLASVLLSENAQSVDENNKLKKFFTRLMQFTGPLMAKGVEDTFVSVQFLYCAQRCRRCHQCKG